MFGIGIQEMVIIGLLFLVVFGPSKLPGMARDIGRFVSGARRHIDDFKSELIFAEEGDQDTRREGLANPDRHAQSASRSEKPQS
jgi:Tat protein translocase TatB subunit